MAKAIARIFRGDTDQPVGVGFWVFPGYLLTCAHVANQALGFKNETQGFPGGRLTLDFPFSSCGDRFHAVVTQWFPVEMQDVGRDIAVLELSEGLPDDVTPMSIIEPTGLPLVTKGYPAGYSAVNLSAELTIALEGQANNGWVQLNNPSGLVTPGFSGAPVWEAQSENVVGMIVASAEARQVAWMISASVLRSVLGLPEMAGRSSGSSTVNPFTYGTPVSSDRFYGRQRAIAEIKNRIGAASPQCLNLVGLRRSGKTSLLHYVQSRPNEFFAADQKPLLVLLDLQDGRYHTPIGMNEGLRQGILDGTGTSPWEVTQNDDPYAIEDGLIALRESGVRLIVMLDELERIGKRLDQFQDWGDDWRSKASAELLTLVIATGRSLGEVYEQFSLTSPFANIFSKTVVGGLEAEIWRSLVREGLPLVTEQELDWVDRVSGGMAFYVQMAASMLFQYGDLEEADREFWFQAEDRFGELWGSLNGPERSALKFAMGFGGVEAGRGLRDRLMRYGLIRFPFREALPTDGRLFSSAFGEWIRENGGAV